MLSKRISPGKDAAPIRYASVVASIATLLFTSDRIGPELKFIGRFKVASPDRGVEETDPKIGDNFLCMNGMTTGRFVVTTPTKVSRTAQ